MKFKDIIAKSKKHYILLNLAGMLVVTLILLLGVTYGLDVYTHHGREVEIPDIQGKPVDVARMELEQLGLEVQVSDTGYVKKLSAGCVLDQIPEAGTMAKEGHIIYVVINSSTSPRITIPDIIDNSSLREAEAKLRALGFKIIPARLVEGEKDWVYGLECNGREVMAGDKIPAGRTLRVVVGDGSTSIDSEIDSTYAGDEGIIYEGGDVDEFEAV